MKKSTMKMFTVLASLVILGFSLPTQSISKTSLEETTTALNMIADFADQLCEDIPLQGKENNLELSAGIVADLKGLIKYLANLGFNGAIKYQSKDYEGLLQKDLLNALKDRTECKREVWIVIWNDLKDKLVYVNKTSNKLNYTIWTTTGPERRHETDDNVFISIIGSNNAVDNQQLDNPHVNDFESGRKDVFGPFEWKNLGKIQSINLRMGDRNKDNKIDGWYCKTVKIRSSDNQEWNFKINQWLDDQHGRRQYTDYISPE